MTIKAYIKNVIIWLIVAALPLFAAAAASLPPGAGALAAYAEAAAGAAGADGDDAVADGEGEEGEVEGAGDEIEGDEIEGEVAVEGDESGGEESDEDAEEGVEDAEEGEEPGYVCGDDYYGRFAGEGISINVYNWGEYISDGSDDSLDINGAFTELTGIRVNYSTYATNEELYSKLRSGYASYDVIIPSDYMVGRLANEGMLLKLDFGNIPNFKFIDERFLSPPYDPHSLYSAPYTWGYVGIIYNREKIIDEEELNSWNILWNEKYLGEILMFSNSRDAFSIAQIKQGYSMNTTDERELYDCLAQLKLQKPLVQAYVMDEIFDKMLGGEAALAPYYAGDALTMMAQNENLGFSIPEEGTNLFVDAMCIPAGSRQKEAAEMYINFMLEPAVGAANSEYIGYATPNKAAIELLDDETRYDPVAYPDESDLGKTENFISLPYETSRLMDQLWTELLSADEAYNKLLMPLVLLIAFLISIGINIYRSQKKRLAHRN